MVNLRDMFECSVMKMLGKQFKLERTRIKWRKKNKHNSTMPMNNFPISLVDVGKETYGELNIVTFGDSTKLSIGNYVSISQNVYFFLDSEHYTKHISTFPFKVKMLKSVKSEAFSKGDIIVSDDVWIGFGSMIMSGVRIGKGAIVAAGSIVTKDVPEFAIVAGIPAQVIKYRFDDTTMKKIRRIDYTKLSKESIADNIELLYRDAYLLSEDDIKKLC